MTTYKEYIEQNEVSCLTLEQGFDWLYMICDISTVSSFFNASEISIDNFLAEISPRSMLFQL